MISIKPLIKAAEQIAVDGVLPDPTDAEILIAAAELAESDVNYDQISLYDREQIIHAFDTASYMMASPRTWQ